MVRYGPRGAGPGESRANIEERWTLVVRWMDATREYNTQPPHACATAKREEVWCEETPENLQWARESASWGALPSGSKRKA